MDDNDRDSVDIQNAVYFDKKKSAAELLKKKQGISGANVTSVPVSTTDPEASDSLGPVSVDNSNKSEIAEPHGQLNDDFVEVRSLPRIGTGSAGYNDNRSSATEFRRFKEKKEMQMKRAYGEISGEPSVMDEPPKSKAWGIMGKMGYKKGSGLGQQEQGRSEPVALSTQRGRRGLGLAVSGLEPSFDLVWDQSQEKIEVVETPHWLPSCSKDFPTAEELDGWFKIGQKKLNIDDETLFCSSDVLRKVLSAKSVFDQLPDRELRNARTRANPFESIRGVFFQNRAAMKMANMDAVFDFMFTEPKDKNGKFLCDPSGDELLYFADVCAGPGGFTEYMLWKLKWHSHGFGFTLKGKDDFKLYEFLAASPEMFEPHYGVHGAEGDGDVTNPENLKVFRAFVLEATGNKGIHTFMADGGFSVEGQENIQEILSKRLYLCQFLCALSILRTGGNMVCKLFDVFTPFSVGLVYLMYRCFDRICLHKPNTSRPANSERYIICNGRRDGSDVIHDYMLKLNLKLNEFAAAGSDEDIVEAVPLSILQEDKEFFRYVCDNNDELGNRQAMYLAKYKAFAQNTNLTDLRQHDLREACLAYWHIPDLQRPQRPRNAPTRDFQEICGEDLRWMSAQHSVLNLQEIDNVFVYCSVVYCDEPHIFLALGHQQVFKWEGSRWEKVEGVSLPRKTVLFGEITQEFKGEGKGRMSSTVFRVIDAFSLAGDSVHQLPYTVRMRRAKKFCRAICREQTQPRLTKIKTAEVIDLRDLTKLKDRLVPLTVKGADRIGVLCPDSDYRLAARGLLLFNIMKEPWVIAWSKKTKRMYYFHRGKGTSIFEMPSEKEEDRAFVNFEEAFASRIAWEWKSPDVVFTDSSKYGICSFNSVIATITEKLVACGALENA